MGWGSDLLYALRASRHIHFAIFPLVPPNFSALGYLNNSPFPVWASYFPSSMAFSCCSSAGMPCLLLLYLPRSSSIVQDAAQRPLFPRILFWSPQLENIALRFEFLMPWIIGLWSLSVVSWVFMRFYPFVIIIYIFSQLCTSLLYKSIINCQILACDLEHLPVEGG